MAYNRGSSTNIIVGAAALFTFEEGELADGDLPELEGGTYRTTLSNGATPENGFISDDGFRNVGFTMNGLEIVFQPDFGEVQVDQFLDVAKLYKQGMQVNLNTAFAEATLENLLFSLAGKGDDLDAEGVLDGTDLDNPIDNSNFAGEKVLNLSAGDIGECPVERGLVAVGPGTGDCNPTEQIERIYVAYRALSIENVTVSAKRDEPSMFEVSFRLLPQSATASYGKIVDRTIPAGS
jgi:hypothetical protein